MEKLRKSATFRVVFLVFAAIYGNKPNFHVKNEKFHEKPWRSAQILGFFKAFPCWDQSL